MVFSVYPLDVHSGTTLWETGHGWMIDKGQGEFFIGQAALTQSRGKERLWLAGLSAIGASQKVLPVGSEVYSDGGEIAGYVTSAAYSVEHERALAFAHLKKGHGPGDILTCMENQNWLVRSLPFSTVKP
jgi:glycine cleavage system aminomethyltransferase T